VDEQKSDWPRIAAWCFGIWSLMLPLSAGVIVAFQSRLEDNQDRLREQIVALRSEVIVQNSAHSDRITTISVRQQDVIRRLEAVERDHDHESGPR
jgi:hypothetical protein